MSRGLKSVALRSALEAKLHPSPSFDVYMVELLSDRTEEEGQGNLAFERVCSRVDFIWIAVILGVYGAVIRLLGALL